MPLLSANGFAEFARMLSMEGEGLGPPTLQTYLALSALDPLPAVIQCAKDAGAITPQRATQLSSVVSRDRFAALVKPDDPLVLSAEDMKRVPRGAFIAFIFVDPPTTIAPRNPIHKGLRHLIHVMVSLGNGWAAGTKGNNIGLPVTTANWDRVNLANCLLWNTVPGTYDAIAESLGLGSPRHLRIRYREVETFQEDDTLGAAPALSQNLVPSAVLRNYTFFDGWWHYPPTGGQQREEGWKLHVSCEGANAAQILQLALPVLRANNFMHKFLLTRAEVAQQDSDPVQKGKVLAIYPDSIVEAFNIVGIIDAALRGHANRAGSPVVVNEIAVGNTVVYTRYGPFQAQWILNQAGDDFVPDPKGVAYPAWIQNPWINYPDQSTLAAINPWPTYTKLQRKWIVKNTSVSQK